ncbi:MAG: GNAT family N-acetyltransferase [Rhodoferax sp.]|nr:GNAT family N-acetyltransferase [Rhodoferax sp.]
MLTALSTYYSSLFAPTGDPELASVGACRAVVRHLLQQPGSPGVIDLQPLDTGSAFYTCMQAALRAEGWWVDTYFCFGNWHLQVGGRSFDTYYPNVPSRLRNTIRRGRKKLDNGGAWSLEVQAEPGPALEAAIAAFDTIYRKSWKVPEPYPDFVPGLCRTAARKGWLRLGVVRLGGVPIAAQLWLVRDNRALIYKLAYDEEFKRLSAGSVLSAEMMRRAIDDERVVDVDYLTGDDGYKADWMSHRRERRGIVAFHPSSLQGLSSAARHFAGRAWARHRAAHASAAAAPAPADETS